MPISRIDDQGVCDFLIKMYMDESSNVNGSFSKLLLDSDKNDQFMINGPYGSWVYHGYGNISLKKKYFPFEHN